MSHAFWTLYPMLAAKLLNSLALFFALAGAWLLLATRVRELQAKAKTLVAVRSDRRSQLYSATAEVNRVFYGFGAVCLMLAIATSTWSLHL